MLWHSRSVKTDDMSRVRHSSNVTTPYNQEKVAKLFVFLVQLPRSNKKLTKDDVARDRRVRVDRVRQMLKEMSDDFSAKNGA